MLTLTSDSFADHDAIPVAHLGPGHGDDQPPMLRWEGEPDQTAAFALTLLDDDAPDYVHLVALLGAGVHRFDATNVPPGLVIGQGTRVLGYEGPCPPEGTHHYRFVLRALSARPDLEPGFTRDELEQAIAGTVLATAELHGTHDAGLVRGLRLRAGRVKARLLGR